MGLENPHDVHDLRASQTQSWIIRIAGHEATIIGQRINQILGVVPQETALYTNLSAEENLRFWGTVNGIPAAQISAAVDRVLALVGLTDRRKGKVSKYSGGMKRRLNIAAGLIHHPKLLIMDEPTVGIDPQSRNHILETVRSLKDEGMTVLYTSHYVEEVEYLCDRVGIMDEGRLIAAGTVSELLGSGPQNQQLMITLENLSEGVIRQLTDLDGVKNIHTEGRQVHLLTDSAEKMLPHAFNVMIRMGSSVSEIKIKKPNLESLFLSLTGKALRDS